MGLFDFFSGGTPPKYTSNKPAFDRFAGEMDKLGNRYQGMIDTGNQARGIAFDQYQKLINDPNFIQDMIAKGFSESPYQKELLDRTQKRMNMNSANTGMLGSGAANRALQDELLKMSGQFQDQYIQRGMGSYAQGMSGLGGLMDLGFKGLGAQDNLWEQGAAGRLKGDLSENEANQRNAEAEYAAKQRGIGNILGLGAGIVGQFGGIGGIASSIGNFFGGGSPGNVSYGSGGYSPAGNQIPQPPAGNFNVGSWSY